MSEKIVIWRVENSDGEGPYRAVYPVDEDDVLYGEKQVMFKRGDVCKM